MVTLMTPNFLVLCWFGDAIWDFIKVKHLNCLNSFWARCIPNGLYMCSCTSRAVVCQSVNRTILSVRHMSRGGASAANGQAEVQHRGPEHKLLSVPAPRLSNKCLYAPVRLCIIYDIFLAQTYSHSSAGYSKCMRWTMRNGTGMP